jgi:signal transduction histidine kinase
MTDHGRRPGLARALAFLALVLSLEGGFALAVMAFDRGNRGLPSDLGYVALVEGLAVFLALLVYGLRLSREAKALAKSALDPLSSALPPAPGHEAAIWRDFALKVRAKACEELASQARSSRQDLESFLVTVHALKTPATTLSLMAEKADRDGSPISVADLRLEVDQLDRILDRTIGRLRLEDFDRGTRIAPIPVDGPVRASIRKHRRLLIARGIAVEACGSFPAETDGYWLSFILDQLVSNAAKYATSRIAVMASPAGRRGIITVVDDGPGLDEEDRLRAFGRSASGSAGLAAATNDGTGGGDLGPSSSGYGLHLAREAARRLGAGLSLESSEVGTTAILDLPLALDPRDDLTPM